MSDKIPQSTFGERLDGILYKLKTDAVDARSSCTERGNWEDYNGKYDAFEQEAKAAITSLVLEEKIDEFQDFEWNDAHMYVHTRLAELRAQQRSIITKESN